MNENYIIYSFMIQDKNNLNDIKDYIKKHIKNEDFNTHFYRLRINIFLKKKIISYDSLSKNYFLTEDGNKLLLNEKIYYSRIIIRFFKKIKKRYKNFELKEKRFEQQKLRKYLLENRKKQCVFCDKKLPLCLLEVAHLKPRCILSYEEKIDDNIGELMCKFCHSLYDNGFLGVNKGYLSVSAVIKKFDLNYENNKFLQVYNSKNSIYFDFHYKTIFNEDTFNSCQ